MSDVYNFMNSIWIPILLAILCTGCGIYMRFTGEPGIARRKDDNRLLKNKEQYVKNAMLLLFFMAIGCVIMALIIYFLNNDQLATIESITWLIIFGILWKRNEDQNGAM